MKQNNYGFTLIELMVVVGIIGILGSIAIPAYEQYVIRSRRAEAQSTLAEWTMRVERARAKPGITTYELALAESEASAPATTQYAFTSVGTANTYTLSASTVAGSKQNARDSSCSPLQINQAGERLVNGAADTNNCWQR